MRDQFLCTNGNIIKLHSTWAGFPQPVLLLDLVPMVKYPDLLSSEAKKSLMDPFFSLHAL